MRKMKKSRSISGTRWRSGSGSIGILLLLLLVACAQAGTLSTTSSLTQPPLTVGYSESTSGQDASAGKALAQGYQLWADMLNQSTGLLGHPVQLVVLHDDSTPAKVAANYRDLITRQHVNFVLGPATTPLVLAAAQVSQQYGEALIEGSGADPAIYSARLSNLFAVSLPNAQRLDSFALYLLSLARGTRPRTAAYVSDDAAAQEQVQRLRIQMEQGGVQTVLAAQQADTAAQAVAQKVIQSGAQVVVLAVSTPANQTMLATFQAQHYNPAALLVLDDQPASEGIFLSAPWNSQEGTYQNAAMVQAYSDRYQAQPAAMNPTIAQAFAAGQVLAQAVAKGNSTAQSALLAALKANSFATVEGPVQFDTTGRNMAAFPLLLQWQQHAFVPVFPTFLAKANPEFPKPAWS